LAFRVEIAPSALADAEAAYFWIRAHSASSAESWLNGLIETIHSLEEFPRRCARAPESEELGREVRHLLYGKHPHVYRILFGIVGDDAVRVYRIRHGARDRLRAEDLETDVE
jgi:plasmid stabilization system protein ParE